MSRSWMFASRTSNEYKMGVDSFLEFAIEHAGNLHKIFCPCVSCGNTEKLSPRDIKDHLIIHGIDRSYTKWIWHGEMEFSSSDAQGLDNRQSDYDDDVEGDRLEDMIHTANENLFEKPEVYEQLLSDAEKPLYDGCTKFTRLSATLKLFNLKAGNGWSDSSFTSLLQMLNVMFPEGNVLPCKTYDAKKILSVMGLNYEKIHACPNDCILYRHEYASLERCPNEKCNAPRYKDRKVPSKVIWYFPIIPRFRRLFGCQDDALNLTWHEDERVKDGKLRHPADSPQWKNIDFAFPDFGCEPRNLRLALCTDGMNPYGSLSSSYSVWPVLLVMYNLPPWLCMKRKYMLMPLLISGPRQPGNDIDVFLSPLIEDLKFMWEEGVNVFDAKRDESFRLRALLFCTINDFPAYGNLSGYSVKGHYACPICEDNTSFRQLRHSCKTVYQSHRRFLPFDHRYRKFKKAFDGSTEFGVTPIPLTGEQIFDKLKTVSITYGKKNKKDLPTSGWKRCSKLYELPYWKHLFVRHCLDVMHVEKNVCDSLIGTLLNVKGKSKDGVKARHDLVELGIRPELAPVKKDSRTYLPPASYTLSRKEKLQFCEFLHGVKVPDGHCSNIRSLVSMPDLKLVGLKSHDCHILMQQLLPIAIRGILPKGVRDTITRLCLFFNAICSKVVDPEQLNSLQREIVLILCQLEMYFPPSFFDIMVHLTVHLVNEVRLCGPTYLRWMYPFERHMKVLKGYVKNRSRPEGCIAERYVAEEAVEFCSAYLSGVDSIGIPKSKHGEALDGEGIIGRKVVNMTDDMRRKAHMCVLDNDTEVQAYKEAHMDHIKSNNPTKSESWLAREHNRTFMSWFKRQIECQLSSESSSVSRRLRFLSYGPDLDAISYTGYRVNGYTFYTKEQDEKSVMQNSGVTLIGEAMHVASAKDKNPVYASMSYYGQIRHIWVLDYSDFKETIFSCDWVDNRNGVRVDEYGFTLVDLNRLGHKEDPFIMALHAKQVFYVTDPSNKKWSVVLTGKNRHVNEAEYDIDAECPLSRIPPIDECDRDADLYVRNDHLEGIWIDKGKKRRRKM